MEKKTVDFLGVEQAVFDLEEMISLPDAVAAMTSQDFKVDRQKVVRWIKKYAIGKKVGGRYYIYPDKLELLLSGDLNKQ